MKEDTEQNWVERAKVREPAAIAELFRRYWRAARAAAYGITGNLDLAEDAACEAFYAAIDGLTDLKDTQRFGPWLRTIVIRTAKRAGASQSRGNVPELQKRPDAQPPTPSNRLEQQELAALIHEAVAHLSATLREAVSLFYFEGYSLKDAARFLDVPEGTLKRRLHEGRKRLRDAAEQIIKGTKLVSAKRKQILQQLRDASEEGIHSEAFFQAARQALRLRPVPNDLLKEIMLKHWADKKEKMSTPVPEEKERKIREYLVRIYAPSQNATDPNHPVGAVANAIRAAMPEFQQWQLDWSCIDISKMVREVSEGNEQALSFLRPPGFSEGPEGAYISAKREWLLQDEDGSLGTPYEMMQKNDTMEDIKKQIKKGKRLSDTLSLLWKRTESIELRSIEELLRRLSDAIIPKTPVSFCCYDDPRYRTALRMQLGDNSVPAAIGGVLASSLGLPETIKVASVTIYLEPWATAQSGQTIELTDFSSSDFLENK